MTEGAPPPKKPARFVAVGCSVLLGIGIVIAGVVGFVLWKINKGIDELAEVGSRWLVRQARTAEAFGDVQKIERVGSADVQIRKDGGDAAFDYRVTGSKGSGRAWVRMIRLDGEWRPTGARIQAGDGGPEATIGSAPEMPKDR